MLKDFLFTSESVSEGHPDKVSDQISDAVLDAYLSGDRASRVACETLVTTDYICVAGEITSQTQNVDVEKIARQVAADIGYTHDDIGFDAATAKVDVRLHEQSPDISQGVSVGEGKFKEQGAGDQGMMFGFAIDETPELMPTPIFYSHEILKLLARERHDGRMSEIRPDSKSQVTVEYVDGKPTRVNTVVVSTQHTEGITQEQLSEAVIESVIKKVIPANLLENTRYLINPTGKFVVGGPHGDCGLTGRKIIVDTYGGWGRHGGGAFSGKDPSKVDRSAAYMARYAAKNVVAAGLAKQCEVQVSYAIGFPEPVSLLVDSFGTGTISDKEIAERVSRVFDFKPSGIMKALGLLETGRTYRDTAAYGHFGRTGDTFTWERTDRADELKKG